MIRGLSVAPTLDPINIGVGKGISIFEMAQLIKELVGYQGELVLDPTKPDGAPYKTVDGSRGREHFDWQPSRQFRQGIEETINWYLGSR
jgi:GDP-L-fucose synthase